MKMFMRRVRKFAVPLLVVPVVSVSAAIGAIAAGSVVPAGAATCTATTSTPCSDTGTLTLSAGTLSATVPSSLGWSGTLSGTTSYLVDSTAGDQSFEVDDNTGSGAGWHVTVSATTFSAGGGLTLPDTGTFSVTGSTSSNSATTAPTATCVSTCTLPTDTTSYPVAVTTAASSPTAVDIYDTAASTGLGDITIGGSAAANPVGWWLAIPPTAQAGTYTSTIVFSVVSGP